MCGICGFVSKKDIRMDILKMMNHTLAHRGPDDSGEEIYNIQNEWNVGFGHRRLSIMDLSQRGHQPMHSHDRRVSVIYNGEIYNYAELKEELQDYPFVTHCDTEIILAAYLKWGIKFVNKINGMFSIALFDRETGAIYLLRDRIGKKPLFYYISDNDDFVFASELKAILCFPGIERKVNVEVVGKYLSRRYLVAPETMFQNIYKLEPGTFLEFKYGVIKKTKYWDVSEIYNKYKRSLVLNYEEAKEGLKEQINKAIALRLIADVPVGAFISGGYDSSVVCAIAQDQMTKPLNTFCIGFEDETYDEAKYAKKIADHIGSNHTELYITEQDVLELIDSIPKYYDEPFADPSMLPTMFVSELAKKSVSVVLTGDGGDELFGGYDIYTILQNVQKMKKNGIDISKLDTRSIEYRILTEDVKEENKTQTGILGYINSINQMLIKKADNFYYEYESKYGESRYDVIRMLLDTETRLVDYILVKVDRASMKYALECRCPFLDKNVIEYTYRLPPEFKDDNGNQKRILKDIAYEYIPKELLERPKKGFGPPIDQWLRGPLKKQLLDYIDEEFLVRQGIFNPEETRQIIKNYIIQGDCGKWSGKNLSKIVWPYFTFQQWYCMYIKHGTV